MILMSYHTCIKQIFEYAINNENLIMELLFTMSNISKLFSSFNSLGLEEMFKLSEKILVMRFQIINSL